jgi:hypothetical protein
MAAVGVYAHRFEDLLNVGHRHPPPFTDTWDVTVRGDGSTPKKMTDECRQCNNRLTAWSYPSLRVGNIDRSSSIWHAIGLGLNPASDPTPRQLNECC